MDITQRFPLTARLLLVVAVLAALAVLAVLALVPPSTISAHPDPETGDREHPQSETWSLVCSATQVIEGGRFTAEVVREKHDESLRTWDTVRWYIEPHEAGPEDYYDPEGLKQTPHPNRPLIHPFRTIQDDIHEGDESFTVRFEVEYNPVYHHINVIFVNNSCTVTILDDDPPVEPPELVSQYISSNPGSDGVYGPGEIVTVQLTFDKDIVVPRPLAELALRIAIGDSSERMQLIDAAGTILVFAYRVKVGDVGPDGFLVDDALLDGAAITDKAGNAWEPTPIFLSSLDPISAPGGL